MEGNLIHVKTHIRMTQVFIFLRCATTVYGQASNNIPDTTINNLVLPSGYEPSEYGAIPEYVKVGDGKPRLIFIPGVGFDASVFDDFMDANRHSYTMYAITIPGYGKTMAPPMPLAGTSYGDQSWNRGLLEGLEKLIEKEQIQKPVIVGHFTQGVQLALRMAIDYPEKVGGVILMGGQAKFIADVEGVAKEYSLKGMIEYTDKYTSQNWFRHMRRKDFDDGNYPPELYSLDSATGAKSWKQVAEVPISVLVRYLCEFFASDIKTELAKITCPVLVLRPTFNDEVLEAPGNSYIRHQFIDTWNDVSERNPLIQVKEIEGAACSLWKDKPNEVYREIRKFVENNQTY